MPALSKPSWSHLSVRHASSRFHEMRSPTRVYLPLHVLMLFFAIAIALPSAFEPRRAASPSVAWSAPFTSA
eukprot:1385672-Prymnesium_polylepis.1